MVETFLGAVVGWLLQEAGAAGRRRFGDRVAQALTRVVDTAVSRAVAEVHPDPARRAHTAALLKERPTGVLPVVDGAPLDRLDTAVGLWVASIEVPAGDTPPPPAANNLLVSALCREILAGIEHEALRGEGVLHPLWSDYQRSLDTGRILEGIAQSGTHRPARIDYWHPPLAQRPRFVGRDAELTWLSQADDRVRLLYGIGGTGKTALALAFAERAGEAFPDGRVFVDFHSYSDNPRHHRKSADHALAELLPYCGADDRLITGMDSRQRERLWRQAISGRRMLFVWDNVATLEQVEPLLTGQPGCLTLITSRSELDVPTGTLKLEHLREQDAIELFAAVAGAERAHPDWPLVADAARLSAWMPLQILVHAAAVRRRRSLEELVAELAKLPAGDRLARLFASLDLSFHDLPGPAQRAWRALGTHPGPYLTAGTAAAMLDCALDEAVKLLDELVDANFAERYAGRFDRYGGGDEIAVEPRFYAYTAHDLLRDYAQHRAAQSAGETGTHATRLLTHYWDNLATGSDRMWLQVERACLVLSLWLPEPNDDLRELASLTGRRLREAGWYLDAELADWYALHLFEQAQERDGEAGSWWGLAQSAMTRGDGQEAEARLRTALAICRETGERKGEAKILLDLGHTAISRGRHDEGFAAMEEALAISRELGDPEGEFTARLAIAQLRLPVSAMTPADLDRAVKQARILLRLSGRLDERSRASALLFLAQIKEVQRANRAAEEAYRSALEIFQRIGHRHGQANALFGIASVMSHRGGDVSQTAVPLGKALAIYREIGDLEGEAKTLMSLAEAHRAGGELHEAQRLMGQAHTMYRRSQSPLGQASTAMLLAELALQLGDRAEAARYGRESVGLLEAIGSPHADRVRRRLAALLAGA